MLINKQVIISVLSGCVFSAAALAQGTQDSVITVPSVPVGSTVSLGGTVVPYKDVTFSAQIPGRIESIAGEEGDHFKSGAELIAINDDDLFLDEMSLAELRAALPGLEIWPSEHVTDVLRDIRPCRP